MKRFASAFYHEPPLWVEASPISDDQKVVDFASFGDDVFKLSMGCGIRLEVSREGIFAFGFEGWPPGQFPSMAEDEFPNFNESAEIILRRTQVMNAFLAFLYTRALSDQGAQVERMIVTPELVIALADLTDKTSMGFGNARVSHLAFSRYPTTYPQGLPATFDVRISNRYPLLSVGVISGAAEDLADLIDRQGAEGLLLGDLFLRATKAYQDHNHSLCLITSWAIIERLLSRLWVEYQEDNAWRSGEKFIDGPRKARLKDGRTFTASVIIEILSLMEILDLDLYRDLSTVRKVRNDWMHSLKPVDSKDARIATKIAERLLDAALGVSVLGSDALKFHG